MRPRLLINLTVFICLSRGLLYAQTAKITGTVKDSSGNPVAFASVKIAGTKLAASTDFNGRYRFDNIPSGSYAITVSELGYKTLSINVSIKSEEAKVIDFMLHSESIEMNEVVVKSRTSKNGMGHISEVEDGIIYSGKKTEVLQLDSMNANTAQNNPRQVLGRIPGSNYSETEGSGFPSNGIGFRGLNPTQSIETNVRQDGYNITADLYGYPESYYLPPLEAVERIEITRGEGSLVFGPQFGGAINYIIKNGPSDKTFEFTTAQTGGSYGLFNSFNSIGGTIHKWNYYAYVQYEGVDGWRPNSDVRQVLGFGRIEYKANEKFKIGLEYSMLRNQIHMPGGLSDMQYDASADQSFRARNWITSPWNIMALTSSLQLSPKSLLTFKSAFNVSQRNLVWKNEDGGPQTADSISPVTNTYVHREVEHEGFESSTSELRLLSNYNIFGVQQTFTAGVRYYDGYMKRQEGGPGSTGSDFDLNLYGGKYANDLDFYTQNLALFAENTFHIGYRFSVTPGFRYEYLRSSAKGYITDDTTRVNINRAQTRYIPLGGIGLQYQTTHATNLYANISQAYRPTDYSDQTPVGVSSKIDPDLKDASGYNADLGWRGNFDGFLNFDLGAFYLAYNNRIGIETLTDANGNPYTYRTNVANSVNKGLETYIEFNPFKAFVKNSKIGTLSFFNSFAYIDAKYTSGQFKGNMVEFAPKTINRFGITYSIKAFSTTFLISNTSKSFADANNTIYSPDASVGIIPAYQVMDWSGTIRVKNYSLKFGINNLANAKYFTLRTDEYPGPGIIPSIGRSIYFGFEAKF